MMLIGLIGKPSSGKSTLLNALCMTDAKMGNYPFTTIQANRGVAYVRIECPCNNLDGNCNPRSGKCENGVRFVPIEVLDVAGLVPGASEGKGMGNKFLDDLRQANVLIHVVDLSGKTDAEGNQVDSYKPNTDIEWLNQELIAWVSNILFKDWDRLSKKLDADRSRLSEVITEKITGLGGTIHVVTGVLRELDLFEKQPRSWDDKDQLNLAIHLLDKILPIIIAANKIDSPSAQENLKEIMSLNQNITVIPTSGLAELTLRKADQNDWIKYDSGDSSFTYVEDDPTTIKQYKVLQAIQEKILDPLSHTGVAKLLETAVFNYLNMIAVFPVEDQTHLTDQDGRILPDVFLVKSGTTAKELAAKVHTDLADSFIHGILVNQSNKRISASHELENGDILKIVSAAK